MIGTCVTVTVCNFRQIAASEICVPSSGIWHHVIWYKFTDVSEKRTASILKVEEMYVSVVIFPDAIQNNNTVGNWLILMKFGEKINTTIELFILLIFSFLIADLRSCTKLCSIMERIVWFRHAFESCTTKYSNTWGQRTNIWPLREVLYRDNVNRPFIAT